MTAASPLARIVLMSSALAAGLMPFAGDRAAACSCERFTKTELAAASETVFTGKPLQRVGLVGSTIRFEVEVVYKGALGRTADLQVVGDLGRSDVTIGAGCGIVLETGRRYTIFARDHDGDGIPNTNGCFQNVEGDIDPTAYGLPAPRPIGGLADGAAQLAVVAGVLALAGLLALAVVRSARARRGTRR